TYSLATGEVCALMSSCCFRRIPFAASLTHILQLLHILVAARRRRNRLLSQPWRRRSLWLRRYGGRMHWRPSAASSLIWYWRFGGPAPLRWWVPRLGWVVHWPQDTDIAFMTL